MPAHAAETFQHYQVLRRPDGSLWELGRGAMGVTYKAFDTNLRSHVCLKVINAAHLDSESARGRFLREARAAAGLRHRNVASVYHLGNDDQSFFYAMEFVDGETVESLVKRGGPLQPREALNIVLQVSRALGAAHRQGLVHRDIKPANLMVEREDEEEDERLVKVIDFGLARPAASTEGSAHITMGGFVGTPQYSSPEQLQEQDLDTRSDIYSLGITLWFMLVGRPPFTGPLGNVFVQHLTKPPPWDHLGPLAHSPVRPLLGRMLAKDPAERPQTPAELRREIDICLHALAPATADTPVSLPPTRAIRPAPPTAATDVDTVRPDTAIPAPDTVLEGTDALTPAVVPASADARAHAPPPAEDGPDPSAMTAAAPAAEPVPPPVPVIGVGAVLSNRYRLEGMVGEGSSGRVFQARDLAENERLVAIKVLHPGVVEGEEAFRAVEADARKVQAFPHPALLTLDALMQDGQQVFLVEEWVNGFSLVDLLRHRGQLSPREVLRLLESAASAADHARIHGLHGLQLSPREVLTHFPGFGAGNGTRGTDNEGTRSVVALDLDRWPEFILKLDPLGLTPTAGDFVTWAGDRTLLPSGRPAPGRRTDAERRTVSRDTQTSIRGLFTENYLPPFAALAYELLSGTPPPRPHAGTPRLIAVPALREEGNNLLRRCLFSAGDTDLGSAQEFCSALARAAGLLQTPPPVVLVSPPAPVEPVAAALVEPPEESEATIVAPSEAAAWVSEEPNPEAPAAASSDQTLVLGETLAIPQDQLLATLREIEHPASAPLEAEEETTVPGNELMEAPPPVVTGTVEPEVATAAPEAFPTPSVLEMQAPELEAEAPPALAEIEPESAVAAAPEPAFVFAPEPPPVLAQEPAPLAAEPPAEVPEHVEPAAIESVLADSTPLLVEEEATLPPVPPTDNLEISSAVPTLPPVVDEAPVDLSPVEMAPAEVWVTEVHPPITDLVAPSSTPAVEFEHAPEPVLATAPVLPASEMSVVTPEPVSSFVTERAVLPSRVPVATLSLPENQTDTPRGVNSRLLAVGGVGAVVLLGVVTMVWWSASHSRRGDVPTPVPSRPPVASNQAPSTKNAEPPSSRNAGPPATLVAIPAPVNIPPAPPSADTPPDAAPPTGNLPPSVENAPRPTPVTVARSSTAEPPVPSPEPRESSRPAPATTEHAPSAAAIAAAEARKRREREQQEQQAEERRDRELAQERERQREAANEQRQQREREAKPRPARETPAKSEAPPKPRYTPPPKKQAEKPKPPPPPDDDRQRGPAVPFMR